ncbi:uncharacterized protein LOC129742290 [Uranotaenia lowii]|uniref:uncharacterized protein LOC129742290 n=1 Tax=Uranotaenia lowii TaxID=190385 RepID=UPI0024787297|nr:uncharacterized protein LOC129742290 [Uranotaenia lowii]
MCTSGCCSPVWEPSEDLSNLFTEKIWTKYRGHGRHHHRYGGEYQINCVHDHVKKSFLDNKKERIRLISSIRPNSKYHPDELHILYTTPQISADEDRNKDGTHRILGRIIRLRVLDLFSRRLEKKFRDGLSESAPGRSKFGFIKAVPEMLSSGSETIN